MHYTTPFELLVATILSAQCTDVRVNKVTDEMFKVCNTPKQFADLSEEEIGEMIKTCGLYKSKAKKIKMTSEILYNDYNSEVPDSLEELVKLPGVGRKTAGVVLSNAFGHPAIPVDTHVFRIVNRIGIVETSTPEKTEFELMKVLPKGVVLSNAFGHPAIPVDTHVFRIVNRIGIVETSTPEKTEFELMKVLPKERWSKAHHLFIFLGRRMCKARKPECTDCPIKKHCNYFLEIVK